MPGLGALPASGVSPIRSVNPESGSYFSTPGIIASGTGGTEGLLTVTPFVVAFNKTLSALSSKVFTQGGASSFVRMGVYQDDGTFHPGSLVVDAGTVSTATTGVKTITGLSASLVAGTVYWFAAYVSGGGGAVPAMIRAAVASANEMYMGGNSDPGYLLGNLMNDAVAGFSQSGQSGALPATFTATRTQENSSSTGGNVIMVVGKAA